MKFFARRPVGRFVNFVVLRDHAPVMASLRPGVVSIEESAGNHTRFFVRGGFADVNPAG